MSQGRSSAVESSASWRLTDRIGLGFAWFLGLTFCAICAGIILYLAVKGFSYLRPDMLWTNPSAGTSQSTTGGLLAPILGTILVTGTALLVAVPVGVWVAVWLTEYSRPKLLARLVESTVEMMAALPSVVVALFGLVVFEKPIVGFLSQTQNGIVYGKSFFAAGFMLSLLAIPFVVAGVREGLQSIPNHVREASYGLGKSKITTIRRVLLPAARPSVVAGSSVGAGHVIGDTAIIVILLGNTYTLQGAGGLPLLSTLRGTGLTLTSFVYDNAPTGTLDQPQKAFAAAVILILLVLIANLIVDVFARKSRDLKWS